MSDAAVSTRVRRDVPVEDTWDLTRLYPDDAAWEAAFQAWESGIAATTRFAGTLNQGPAAVKAYLDFDRAQEREGDKLGTYAFLRTTEDVADGQAQSMKMRFVGVASRAAELGSFFRPELLALDARTLDGYLASEELSKFRLLLTRIVRYRPHTLSQKEERILALQAEPAQAAQNVFSQLVDADLEFGRIHVRPGEEVALTHGSFMACLESNDRAVRRAAFHQYYKSYEAHANTLAATLDGSVKQDVFAARVRDFSSARAAALFPDNLPETVYDNLVSAVRAHLPKVHQYYQLRRRVMGLDSIHFYDIYTPLVQGVTKRAAWPEAVEHVIAALKPLGDEYVETLAGGLRGRWCDRYENKGKQSGAFSSGCYDSDPYILMNYTEDVFDHVYTLAHEAGHSMHSHYSKRQPYQYSQYTIFVAEVASTFNEQLLGRHFLSLATTDAERAYFLNREIDDIRKTVVRQTMFAEYEMVIHALAEANEPLTLDRLRGEYQELLAAYFGPDFALDAELSLEGLRIPHFYRAFYVYKYATGLAAAVALAERVTGGGVAELGNYHDFLRAGSSKDPLDLLRDAGVDMLTPGPVAATLERFSRLVAELETLV